MYISRVLVCAEVFQEMLSLDAVFAVESFFLGGHYKEPRYSDFNVMNLSI